jgi:hypothetical protein
MGQRLDREHRTRKGPIDNSDNAVFWGILLVCVIQVEDNSGEPEIAHKKLSHGFLIIISLLGVGLK